MSEPGDLARRVHEALLTRGATLAVAESLTGGALAAALVSVPGVSATFRGGVVAYATDLKWSLLGVDQDLLARCGPVHPQVAMAMAVGVRRRLGATYGLATTGVAGPDPQDGHRPGEVHLGLAGPGGGPDVADAALAVAGAGDAPAAGGQHRALRLTGDRVAVRAASVLAALGWLADELEVGNDPR